MCIFGCVKIFGGDVFILKVWEYVMVERLMLLKVFIDKYKCVFKGNIRDEIYILVDKQEFLKDVILQLFVVVFMYYLKWLIDEWGFLNFIYEVDIDVL